MILCQGKPLQQCIDDLLVDLQESKKRFDELAGKLEVAASTDKSTGDALNKYLEGLRRSVTGTVEYS